MNSIFQFPSTTSVLHIIKNILLCSPHETRFFGVTLTNQIFALTKTFSFNIMILSSAHFYMLHAILIKYLVLFSNFLEKYPDLILQHRLTD